MIGFLIYHLLHLTFHGIGPQPGARARGRMADAHGEMNVYRNVVAGFQDPVISVLYIVGQLLLYFHLSHGIQSTFQTLGLQPSEVRSDGESVWVTLSPSSSWRRTSPCRSPFSALVVGGRDEGTEMKLDAKIPEGPIESKWDRHRFDLKLVNPANKRKYSIIMVGTGLAGGSAAASLAELGYQVKSFCFQDSPRRAHSIAAQGGINAAKNYQNDGDSVWRLFYDTVKGGDYRAREGNVYRLAQLSVNIIDQCVAQGVPFAREYGGLLANRSFGGAQVSRTFYARGQTGQQLLLGCYSALCRQIGLGNIEMYPAHGDARSDRDRRARPGNRGARPGHGPDLLAPGRRGRARHRAATRNVFYLSTNAKGCNATAIWRAYKKGAGLRQSLLHPDPPDLHPGDAGIISPSSPS